MNEGPVTLRSETLALDALIQESVARAQVETNSDAADTLIYLGSRQDSFPTAIIIEPLLEPVDKLVWMVVMLSTHEAVDNMSFPRYETIAKLTNVSSRATIARAILILRATRWLTLCTRIRKSSGRFHRNIYALHDEPLPIADALYLNADYLGFLDQSLDHAHARVRTVAQAVLDSVHVELKNRQENSTQPQPIERERQTPTGTQGAESRLFFSMSQNGVRRLNSDSNQVTNNETDQVQNLNMAGDQVQISNAQNLNLVCSSSYKNITTTTTTQSAGRSKSELGGEATRPLVYPPRLCDKQREIADRYLSDLAPEQRQPILDELEGRFRAEGKGMKPVYDEIGFLQSLCTLTKKGEFQPNLGIKVRATRLERQNVQRRSRQKGSVNSVKETQAQRQKRIEAGLERISNMKQALGMRSGHVSNRTGHQS